MAFPVLALIQAVTTLTPLFKKNSLSEKEEAKKLLSANNGPISSSLGVGLMASGLAVGSMEEAVYGLVMGVVGLILYVIQAK